MEHKNLLSFVLLLLFIINAAKLTAQTKDQRVRSAAVLTELLPLPKGIEISSDQISQIKLADLRSHLRQDKRFTSEQQHELYQQLVPKDLVNWRAIAVDFSTQCKTQSRGLIIYSDGSQPPIIYLYFNPNNSCGPLYLAMVEAGLIDPFGDSSEINEYQSCVSRQCISSAGHGCCFRVILRWPAEKDCPEDSCGESNSYCLCTSDIIIWDDLFMDN